MGNFVRHTTCGECGSSDGKALYDDGSSHCFVCQHTVASQEFLDSVKDSPKKSNVISRVRSKISSQLAKEKEVPMSTKEAITEEDLAEIKEISIYDPCGYRGLREETTKKFGVRHSYDEDDTLLTQYYPVTQDGQVVGVKMRDMPKTFHSKGRTGADCELFMQFRFNRGGKYVLLVEGELDSLSAYQMLFDYQKSRSNVSGGEIYDTAVVSPTTGVNSTKQIAAQYKFFDSFEQIIVCLDNDAAGQNALDDVVKALPKGKVKVMYMRLKDPNEYLKADRQKDFIRDFYDAKSYTPVGVLGSGELYNKILAQASVPKVPFPPFMKKLNLMIPGGLPLGHIVNIAAGTGLGKTTYINEIIYYWIFNSPHKIGIVSMELDAGQYGETILSRHLSRKLSLIGDEEQKQKLLTSNDVVKRANELFYEAEDQHRFYLLDNRDGTIEEIQDTIEELVVSCGCKIIVLDPLQDILDGLSVDEQAVFMKWAKGIIKSHQVTLVFINHIRKSASGGANSAKGDSYTEEEIQGSSTIIKSASINILLSRNKYAEDEVERNTTNVMLSKNRVCGLTGPAGQSYYDNETHTLHDKEEYFSN